MKYTHKSFSVAVSDVVSGGSQMCREKGHSMRDSRGRCLCCGEKTGPSHAEVSVNLAVHRDAFKRASMSSE